MSEEFEEEDRELTAEELMELHRQEIEERFEEKGFFRRFSDMVKGLSKPKGSREYKLAKLEMQRLMAPLVAILLPVLGVVVLIVMTAVNGNEKDAIVVDIAKAVEEEAPLEEEQPEPEVEPETPPDETVEVTVDTPVVGPVTDMVSPTPAPPDTPLSVKPAAQDSVAIIKSPVTMRSMTGSRTPGSIGAMTRGGAGYGDANTEGAVLKALRWLKKIQTTEGRWPGDIANTALALLAYLAHGETPASKEFGDTVERGIQCLIDAQFKDKDGTVRFRGAGGNEYGFLIVTYALCEAYGMTKNPNAKIAALAALQRIVDNQGPTGGYDYGVKKTSTRDDLSFEGWALQALKAGKMAGLHPNGLEECIKKAIKCLKTRNFVNGGFNYTAGGGPTGLTATGCLCMQLLGYGDQKEVAAALDTMRGWLPVFTSKAPLAAGGPTPGSAAQYYCYYAAQCKYQAGMREGANPADVKSWHEWNLAMKQLYPRSIITLPEKIEGPDGKMHAMGYWPKRGDIGTPDDVMATCLCALQLMVYYRYLPTTQTKAGKVEGTGGDEGGGKKVRTSKKDEDVAIDVDI